MSFWDDPIGTIGRTIEQAPAAVVHAGETYLGATKKVYTAIGLTPLQKAAQLTGKAVGGNAGIIGDSVRTIQSSPGLSGLAGAAIGIPGVGGLFGAVPSPSDPNGSVVSAPPAGVTVIGQPPQLPGSGGISGNMIFIIAGVGILGIFLLTKGKR